MAISRIYVRRDSAQDWENSNIVLNVGEFGYDITNKKVKIGDGTTAWIDLPVIESPVTSTVTDQQVTNIQNDITELEQNITNIELLIPTSITDFEDTPNAYLSGKRNIIVTDEGEIAFVGDGMIVDAEFRGMMSNLLHHRPALEVTEGDEYDIDTMNPTALVYRSPNNTVRNLRLEDEFGHGGRDVYIRIDGGEPTCDGGGDYDTETNSCFPSNQNVIPASNFQNSHDPNLSGVITGAHAVSGRVRILKTGLYASGWIDVHQIYNDVAAAGVNIASNDSDIANLQNEVANLQSSVSGASAPTYTKETLPLNGNSADLALVTDGTIGGTPTMSYFYQGKWYRTFDNSLITDQTIDIYLLAGQSNAHGHGVVSDLDEDQKTQDGLFYTSWHHATSNASSTQYYSPWASSTVAGDTSGDDGKSTIGGSLRFGPEIGFIERANAINLTDDQPIGVLKHAIGASSLVHPDPTPGDLSDWDLTPEGDKHGDALVAFKLAIADGLTKLTDAGYSYRLAGFIWWQGESGGADNDLIAFIDHMRTWLDDNSYLSMPKAQFPFVITGTDTYWGRTYKANVADADGYVGFVNTQELAAPAWADRTLVHPGSNDTYNTDQDDIDNGYTGSVGDSVGGPDFNNDGVNDMFAIGRAYADQMDLAKSGNTNSLWQPDDVELWLDASDTNTTTFSGSSLTSITDKNSDGSVGSNTFNTTGNIVAGIENNLQTLTFEDDPTYYYGDISYNGTSARVKLDETFAGYADVTNVTSATSGNYQSSYGGTTEGEWKILGTVLYIHKPSGGINFSDIITASESQQGVTVEMLTGNASDSFPAGSLNLSGGSLTEVIAAGTNNGLGSDYIQSSALASPMSSNNQLWFFAIKPINVGTDDSGASALDGMFQVDAKTYLTSIGTFYESNQVLNSTGVLTNDEVSILAIQMNWATSGANGTTRCWIDGTSVGTPDRTQNTNTNTPLASTGTSAWKFMMYNNGQNFLEGEFCEFIATDSLSDREKIEGYLAHKWGIESKLPSGHTYQSSAP